MFKKQSANNIKKFIQAKYFSSNIYDIAIIGGGPAGNYEINLFIF